jgi:hypothetical protein
MHESLRKAHALIARLENIEDDFIIEQVTRDPHRPDALVAWDATRQRSVPRESAPARRQLTETDVTEIAADVAEALAAVIGERVGIIEREITRVDGEIAALRSDVALLAAHKVSKDAFDDGKVVGLVRKGDANAA